MIYIYGLICPISGAVRYIGKSTNPDKRLRAHIGAALRHEYKHHTARWIRKIVSEGLEPVLRILEEVNSDNDWREAERAWIKRAIDERWPITNSTSGGEGLDYLNPDDERAYRRNLSEAMKKFRATDNGKEFLKKFQSAGQAPEARRKAAESIREAYKNPETKKRLAEAMAIAREAHGYKEALSARSKKMWMNPVHRGKFMESFGKSETKAKHSEAIKNSWSDPDTRKRMMNRWTPEARALQSQRIRERQALIQSRMTPEVRAKQAAKLKETWAKGKFSARRTA
jgi:hypothetical protein